MKIFQEKCRKVTEKLDSIVKKPIHCSTNPYFSPILPLYCLSEKYTPMMPPSRSSVSTGCLFTLLPTSAIFTKWTPNPFLFRPKAAYVRWIPSLKCLGKH